MLIDTHSHLFVEEFTEDLPQVMERARKAGVSYIFMPNIDSTTIEPMLKVCSEYKGYCFPMIGLHPTSVDAGYEKELTGLVSGTIDLARIRMTKHAIDTMKCRTVMSQSVK